MSRALVPGAGSGYECLALAEAGWDVLGVDLAATAVAKAEALRDERAKAHGLGRGKLAYVAADFFALNEAQTFDLIFDYTVRMLCGVGWVCIIKGERRRQDLLLTHSRPTLPTSFCAPSRPTCVPGGPPR